MAPGSASDHGSTDHGGTRRGSTGRGGVAGSGTAPGRGDDRDGRAIVHPVLAALEAGLDHIRASPRSVGTVELIVARPAVDEREVLDEGHLDAGAGLVGDSWAARGSRSTPDGSAHPDKQLNVMNARVAQLVAGPRERWALAGDQLYLDLDLSTDHLPAGTRLELGDAVIEVTALPHRGCAKFARRFGEDAHRFVNTDEGDRLRLRGLNARVVRGGRVRAGDRVAVVRGGPTDPGPTPDL